MLYHGAAKRAVIRLKRRAGVEEVALFGGYLAAAVRRDFPEVLFSTVTAVPLHRKKERRRGFNQSKRLAQATAARLGIPYADTLTKVRITEDQHTLSAAERQKNLIGAFQAAHPVSGIVLLVDDVRTTGATLGECARVLRAAGAAQVYAVCLALSSPPLKQKQKPQR